MYLLGRLKSTVHTVVKCITRIGRSFSDELLVGGLRPFLAAGIRGLIKRCGLRRHYPSQKLVHRTHHQWMRREGAHDICNPHRMIRVKAPHQFLLAAHQSYRHSTRDSLSVHHHVSLDAEVFLRAARSETETGEYFVEDQRNAFFSA